MTKEQIKAQMDVQLGEYFDGYVLVAKVAGTGEVVIMTHAVDVATKISLTVGVNAIHQELLHGSIG